MYTGLGGGRITTGIGHSSLGLERDRGWETAKRHIVSFRRYFLRMKRWYR